MLFRKRDHLVGLDIGSSLIKVAEIRETAKGPALKKFGIAEIAPGAIVDGNIQDVEGIAHAIRALFKTHKIKEKNVAISTGGYSVVIKTISIPTASEQELQDSIRFEAEQYIPYDVEDVNIDFQILGTSTFSPDQMNVLLVAVKKDLVAEYMDLTNRAGLNPCIIDVDTFALQNIHETVDKGDNDQVVMLVDVGYSKTSLNIVKGNISLMMRDNSSGIAQIAEEIIAATGCTPELAQDVIWGRETGLMPPEEVDAIRGAIVQKWCSEIYSVVNTYQSKSSEGILDRVVLCGGGAFVQGFTDSLAAEVAAEVIVIDPFSGLIIDKEQFPDTLLSQMAPLAPIALGLALRKVDDK
ncbi:MAG: type IV pilus assembly protein PilM [Desulfobacteraceae bacterium]|nr:type IV pilus assembly protein PilM [Desulfobacteraceae bacterium]